MSSIRRNLEAPATDLGKQVLVIGKEAVLGLHGVRMVVEKSNMNWEVTELDHGGIHVVEIVVMFWVK